MDANIELIELNERNHALHNKFIEFPYRLYAGDSNWVPLMRTNMRALLRKKAAYSATYPTCAFLARRGTETVGTILVSYNNSYNRRHKRNTAHFSFFDFIDDGAVAQALIDRACVWARTQSATELSGPMFSGGSSGSGILIHGFDIPAPMTIMRYNFPYYQTHYEAIGFKKSIDMLTLEFDIPNLESQNSGMLPQKVERVVKIMMNRSNLEIHSPRSKSEMRKLSNQVIPLYNKILADHVENYDMTDREIREMLDEVVLMVEPDMVHTLTYKGEHVGFVIAAPDVTSALQRSRGRITPISIFNLLRAKHRANQILLLAVGILPEYQRLGGNALLYSALSKMKHRTRFRTAVCPHIAETTERMINDLSYWNSRELLRHRVYTMALGSDSPTGN